MSYKAIKKDYRIKISKKDLKHLRDVVEKVIDNINCCIHLSCGQKRFPLFELFFALEFKPQDLILEPWYF